MSIDTWRNLLRDGFRRFIGIGHKFGGKIAHYACGSICSMIPDFIECGLDILNPLMKKSTVWLVCACLVLLGDSASNAMSGSSKVNYTTVSDTNALGEPSLQEAIKYWPEMTQQATFIGLKNCPTKFQIYWNGAISCFVGRDCFGNIFPPQRKLAQQFEKDQLHMTFGCGKSPCFEVIDRSQVVQSLLNDFLPITITRWQADGITFSVRSLASSLAPDELQNKTPEQALCLSRVVITPAKDSGQSQAHLWLNFSGYKCLVSTDKEKPEDVFPVYGRKLRLEGSRLIDNEGRIRASFKAPRGSQIEFFQEYPPAENPPSVLRLARQKGFLKNLLHITVPCKSGRQTTLEIALPYFPVTAEQAGYLERDYDGEQKKIIRYWQDLYAQDAVIETPDAFANNFYKAGLQHTFITADRDAATGKIYAKSSPAWYETIWPNCATVTAVSLDLRGHHAEAESYLEPFIEWQGIRPPPGMNDICEKGFFSPPKEYSAIPWVSNHGNILWAICEHYRITRDDNWKARITEPVLGACDWIINQRALTKLNSFGKGLLPAGTVSDDKGSGQYFCTDAYNYRGLKSAADFLTAIGHPRAGEISQAAAAYRQDIREAVRDVVKRNAPVTLENGEKIPFVPAEINQTQPPPFDMNNFWPYINYIDVGPMHLVDAGVFESDSDIMRWILQFEEQFTVSRLRNDISLTENWCHSICRKGDTPAHLLRYGVSVVEPFYSPRASAFFDNDDIENYLKVFYHQLASGVSHRTLTPAENRYGVWHLPWADGEYHKMLLRMLVFEQGDTLCLLKAIPRRWLEQGNRILVKNQPTSFGTLSFSVSSKLQDGIIEMTLEPPGRRCPKEITIRFRHPAQKPISSVKINGVKWEHFEGDKVILDAPYNKTLKLRVCF